MPHYLITQYVRLQVISIIEELITQLGKHIFSYNVIPSTPHTVLLDSAKHDIFHT